MGLALLTTITTQGKYRMEAVSKGLTLGTVHTRMNEYWMLIHLLLENLLHTIYTLTKYCNLFWMCFSKVPYGIHLDVWSMGALKKIPFSDVICADVRLVNISHQLDLSCWCFLGSLSISCLLNLLPQTREEEWWNKSSDGKMIIEQTLIAICEGLEITFGFGFVWTLRLMLHSVSNM